MRGNRHRTLKCPSVCLSHQLIAAAAIGGFAAEVELGVHNRYRSIAASAARHTGRVNSDPTLGRSNMLYKVAISNKAIK